MDQLTLNLSTVQLLAAVITALGTIVAAIGGVLWLLIKPRVERAIATALERERPAWRSEIAAEREQRVADVKRIETSEHACRRELQRQIDGDRAANQAAWSGVREDLQALSMRIDQVLGLLVERRTR